LDIIKNNKINNMTTKYTKKQKEAIESLILNLDELENKPRRLFYALEKLAFAFKVEHAVPSIREAQDSYYSHLNHGEVFSDLTSSLRHFKIDEWRWQVQNAPEDGVERCQENITAVERFIKTHAGLLTDRRY